MPCARLCLVSIFLLGATARGAESAPGLQAQLGDILSAPAAVTARLGVYVKRLDDGQELYARDADAVLIPASNMKIITSAAALQVLGPDFRYATELYGTSPQGGVVSGDLVLKGYGDPTLVPERLWYLATRLFFAGVREVKGGIVVDDSYFGGPRMANGWEQDRSDSAYMAPTGAVSAGFNVVQVHVAAGAGAGAAARVLVDPASEYALVDNTATTVSRGRTHLNVSVVPEGDRSRVRVSGRINLADNGRSYWRRIDNPPLFAGEVLKSALAQVGVRVRGKVTLGEVPDTATRLATITSERLAQVVGGLNKTSNNFMAEQVALTLGAARFGAPATWEKAQAAIEAFLDDEVGLVRGSYEIRNASGLHDVNKVTSRQMVQVLEYVYAEPRLAPEFVASLSVAGGSGTLEGRMGKTEAAHVLRAKTGTLSVASALSGYVTTKTGETLAFSILVNDYRTPISEIWGLQDQIGATLAALRMAPMGGVAQQAASTALEVATP